MKVRLPAKAFQQFEEHRRKALRLSDTLRIESKSAIGYLLKDLPQKAKEHLAVAEKTLKSLNRLLTSTPYLYSVGGVHVGSEEYVEARLLADYLFGNTLSTLKDLGVTHQDYIGGLCDMSGELLRYARKHPQEMRKIQEDLQDLYQICLEMIVTRNGIIRKKLEDLERNERKMEEMIFQWQLRHDN